MEDVTIDEFWEVVRVKMRQQPYGYQAKLALLQGSIKDLQAAS